MAILNQKRILNLIPKVSAPVTIHVSQGDVGTEIEFTLVKGDEVFVNPGNVSASVHGVREDGANFGPFTCTLSGSKVTFPLHSEMTAIKGSAIAEIVLVDNGGNKVGSANFGILVEESVFPLGVTYDNDVSVYESILAYVQSIPAQLTNDYTSKINAVQSILNTEIGARTSADVLINTRIDEIIAPSGEAPNPAEITDARIGANGVIYSTLGTALRKQIDELLTNIVTINNDIFDVVTTSNITFETSIQIGSDGSILSNTNFIGERAYIPAKKGSIIYLDDWNNYRFNVAYYSAPNLSSFIAQQSVSVNLPFVMPIDGYVRFSMRTEPAATQSDTSISAHIFTSLLGDGALSETVTRSISNENDITAIENDLDYIINDASELVYTIGQVRTGGTFDQTIRTFCGTPTFIKANVGSTIDIDDHTNYRFNVAYYTSPSLDDYVSMQSTSVNQAFVMPIDGYVRFSIREEPVTTLTDSSIASHFVVNIIGGRVTDWVNDLKTVSPYFKTPFYGKCDLQNYVECNLADTRFDKNSTYSELLVQWNTLMSNNSNYITRSDLGVSSDGVNHLYAYELKPQAGTLRVLDEIPKIILISGQHGFEKAMPYGLFYFAKMLCDNWTSNPVLDYIRNHVHLIIVPCVNPYGFNNLTYKNADNVNLNRNYNYNWEAGSGDDYGGTAAFSEPETQAVRDLLNNNIDAVAAFDLHTNGSSNVSEYKYLNWYSMPNYDRVFSDDVMHAVFDVASDVILSNTAHFANKYNLNLNGEACGQITLGVNADSATFANWARYVCRVEANTIEGFCGFPNELVDYTPDVQNANAEIIANFMSTFLNMFSKLK